MYNDRYVTELSISEVKEYYEILRRNRKLTHEESAEFGICKERLIAYAYKNIDKAEVLDKIRAEIEQTAFKDMTGSKYIFVNRVNQIIDKYKEESEDEEE